MRAKGMLLMRKAGFEMSADEEIREKFEELKYWKKNIGPNGKLAISPYLHISSRYLWQLNLLEK